jgi:hypothetical protein
MSSRTHRKALPLDPTGIHWGTGERHESGTRWEPDEWKRFVAWALENGASSDYDNYDIVGWCETGGWHRENGPARVWAVGYESWWLNDQLHREDGPATIDSDGSKTWYLNGIQYTDGTFAVEMTE